MITVKHETEDMDEWTRERCCFCRRPTRYWHVRDGKVTGESVACCPDCAKRAEEKDVPSKKDWIRRERIAYGGR